MKTPDLRPEPARSFDEYLQARVAPRADEIAVSKTTLNSACVDLFEQFKILRPDEPSSLTPDEFSRLYGVSIALAFTIGQHISAFERLQGSFSWQLRNPNLFDAIAKAETLCGLATTQLAKPGPPTLIGTKTQGGYELSGTVPWCTGHGVFQSLLVGFVDGDDAIFALIDFPLCSSVKGLKAKPLDLAVLDSTSSVSLEFDGYFVADNAIVDTSTRNKPPTQRFSKYLGCEIGVAAALLKNTREILNTTSHPRNTWVSACLSRLEGQLFECKTSLAQAPAEPVNLARIHILNQNAVHLLAIASGPSSLLKGSMVSRVYTELLLFDFVIQSPKMMELKIDRLAR